MFAGGVMTVGPLQTWRRWLNTSRFGVAVLVIGEILLIAG